MSPEDGLTGRTGPEQGLFKEVFGPVWGACDLQNLAGQTPATDTNVCQNRL
ncbi:hypothetical protein EM6_2692 [Asticcacaulis excentricus]|uniref:Uncharacterized protein n=1 Tax=Asticcacaulis excentricus TaxID=78587 RepID=A0A3G9G854_9CAUL|nr:hypothetical protein EM6_2692 [Asticcacaulis excentricus]